MKVKVSAPSNIALIKYMGKSCATNNRPLNRSLSWTLNHLRTFVEVEEIAGASDQLVSNSSTATVISPKGKERFLKFLSLLKSEFGLKNSLGVSSFNNFPQDCGLASSASSFAALTLATYKLAKQQGLTENRSPKELAQISQRGSGSSGRSFFSPWAEWNEEGFQGVELPITQLLHQVVVISDQPKSVSSSTAHQRVATSLLLSGRAERAQRRLQELKSAFQENNWVQAFELCWQEFWDMHLLFETSSPPFGYLNSATMEALTLLRRHWDELGDGPLVTLDAGPNIHLLYRKDQNAMAEKIKALMRKNYGLLCSQEFNKTFSEE